MRAECPVHRTDKISEFPGEPGFWSITTADDVRTVSMDWETYSSERGGITTITDPVVPVELIRSMFIGMDPPKHDRLKMLFQRGFTPKRIAEHEDAIREITIGVLDRLEGRETCDLVEDVAQPVVSRVIGSFMGIDPSDDIFWARPDELDARRERSRREPGGHRHGHGARRPGALQALRGADRRAPREPAATT